MSANDLLTNYIFWLIAFSVLVTVFEVIWPAREQKIARKWLWSDYVHLAFNGHLFGLLLYGIATYHVLPHIDGFLAENGLKEVLYFGAVESWGWGLVLQSFVALVVLDFVQWLVHNTLHRVDFLWEIHKVHHSVKEGEMDWIVSFRFSWIEPVIYKSVMYIPAMWFGFAPEALFFHAVFGTLIGHLNHANLTWDYGPLRYVFNSPRMHLYHHAYDAPAHGQNFGITLSCWDWIFGTHHLPDEPCPKIGFPGVNDLPNDFFGQLVWPLPHFVKGFGKGTRPLTSILGIVVLAGLYGASLPAKPKTPMFNEPMASSQPTGQSQVSWRAESAEDFAKAVGLFGSEAKAEGWLQSQYAISAKELASALGAPKLIILDVRAGDDYKDRFAAGHIPSAQLVTRSDYSGGSIPGMSFGKEALQKMLQAKGAQVGGEIVITGDGGPEPYRLWWTLLQVGGVKARVLNGGLAAWKHIGEAIAAGDGQQVTAGNIELKGGNAQNLVLADLKEIQNQHANLQYLDTRSVDEFTGKMQHKKSTRAGRIPGAKHLLWTEALKLVNGDVPVLKSVSELKDLMNTSGIQWDQPLITYCQSGTRSAAVYYGLIQAGYKADQLWNYDGSWAEYSRSTEKLETGAL